MLMQFALKNILAYKKRSLVTFILTAISTALLIFSTAFMDGSHSTMIQSAVEVYPGYIQITGKDFRETPGLDNLIEDVNAIRTVLENTENIDTYAARFETFVLYAAGEKAIGGLFTGIEPEKEQRLSRLAQSLIEGNWLSATDQPQIYIGTVLADKLKVRVGDTISFIGTAADYSFAADNLIVEGIFQTGLYDFDASSAFVSKKYFDMIMGANNMATHMIVLPEIPDNAETLAMEIDLQLEAGYECLSWQQTMTGLLQAMELDSVFGYITLGIIFIVIFFVIMIYTLLMVFTRIREIGVLRAIGTSPIQIFTILLSESAMLSVAGVILGGILGGMVAYYFQVHPIMPSGYEEQFKQYGLVQTAMPATFSLALILRDMTIMLILATGSTIYPIVRVLGYNPVEAINHV